MSVYHCVHVIRYAGRSLIVFLVTLSAVLLLAGCGRPHEFAGTALGQSRTAFDFAGTNWNGTPFQLQELRGKVVLLFFGYTNCPDVCPLTLAELQQVKQELGEQADELAVVFVTVDLETDTVKRLAGYIPAFDPTFYGVRMDETTLAAAQEAYGIYAEKVDHGEHTAHGDSTVGHSDYTLAIDPQGNWRVVYAADVVAEGIAADVRYLLTE